MARPAYTWDDSTLDWVPFSGPEGPPGPAMNIHGSVATTATLPANGKNGDAWIVDADGGLYVWSLVMGTWYRAGTIAGPKGDPGETLKISGAVATAADLPAAPNPLTVFISSDDSSLYIYDPASSAAGVNAPSGYVNLGAIAGPPGKKGDVGPIGPKGSDPVVRGSVAEVGLLPTVGTPGEIRIVEKTGHLYSWDPTAAAWEDGGKIRVDGAPAFFGRSVPDTISLPFPGKPGEARIVEDTMSIYSWNAGGQLWEEAGVLKSVPDGTNDGQTLVWQSGAWVPADAIPSGRNQGDVVTWDANNLKWVSAKPHLGYEDNITITPTVSDTGTLVYDEISDSWDVRKIKVSELADGPGAAVPQNGDVLGYSTAQQKWVATDVSNLVLPWTAKTYLTGALTYHNGEVWRAKHDAQGTDRPGDPTAAAVVTLDPANLRARLLHISVPGTYGVEDADWSEAGMGFGLSAGDYFWVDTPNQAPYLVTAGLFAGYTMQYQAKIVWLGDTLHGLNGWAVVQPSDWDGSTPKDITIPGESLWQVVGPKELGEIPNVDTTAAKADDLLVFDGLQWKSKESEFANHAEVNLRIENFAIGIARTTSVIAITNTPVPSQGLAFYIVGPNPTGAWAGHAHKVAYWATTSRGDYEWHFHTPQQNETHLVEDEAKLYTFDGVNWGAAAISTGTGVPDGSTDGELLVWKTSLSRWEPELPQAVQNNGQIIGTVIHSLLTEGQFITASGTDSNNWRLCDGRSAAGTTYAQITGRGSVPDLRGAYFRMAGQNNSNIAWKGGDLLSWQDDTTRRPRDTALTMDSQGAHSHNMNKSASQGTNDLTNWGTFTVGRNSGGSHWSVTDSNGVHQAGAHTHTINGGGDAETKPKTFAVNYFIRVN